jgi:hypothetical protein
MEWELDKHSKKCALCNKGFETGESYKSVLNLNEEALLKSAPASGEEAPVAVSKENPLKNSGLRQEYCPSCWEIKKQELYFDYFWQGRCSETADPEKTPSTVFNPAAIQEIFIQSIKESRNFSLSDEERLEKNGIAYLLALFLERKRLLKHKKDAVVEGVNCALYEEPKTGTIYTLRHPLFSAEWAREYQQKIAVLLHIPSKQTPSPQLQTGTPA